MKSSHSMQRIPHDSPTFNSAVALVYRGVSYAPGNPQANPSSVHSNHSNSLFKMLGRAIARTTHTQPSPPDLAATIPLAASTSVPGSSSASDITTRLDSSTQSVPTPPAPKRFRSSLRDLQRLFQSRLSLRIVFWIFLSLAIIEGLLLIPSIQRERREILSQIQDVSSGKIQWILMTYDTADGEELLGHVEGLASDPMLRMILGGAVYNSAGQRIGVFGEPPSLSFEAAQQGDVLYVQRPLGDRYDAAWVARQPSDTYFIVIRHNAAGMRTRLIGFALRVTGTVVIIAAFVTLVVMLSLGPNVISPILKLRRDLFDAGTAIAEDSPPPEFQTAAIRRHDELGEVVGAFRQMFHQIVEAVQERKQAESELRDTNEQMRLYILEMERVTAAAAAVEEGTFQPDSLQIVAQRSDELGRLARVFQHMAEQVREREYKLKQQVVELQIEIDRAKCDRQVAEIVETDYFRDLKAQLEEMRRPGDCWDE